MKWRSQFRKFARGRDNAEAVPGNPVFDEFLAAKRADALKAAAAPDADPGAARRRARAVVRTVTNNFRERSRQKIPSRVLAFRQRNSRLIDTLIPPAERNWLGPFERARQGASMEVDLTDFSFLDFPEESLTKIAKLVRAESGAWEVQVHFDDGRCLDIAPYLVIAMIWRDLAPIFMGGRMTREIQRVIDAVQLRHSLHMGSFRMTEWDRYNVHAFPIHRRRPANTSSSATRNLDPQSRERVGDGLVRSMNQWLDHPELGMELTASGRANIKNIVGEILDNAERHSMPTSMDGDWTIAGFMARRPSEADEHIFQCSIAFVSIGTTIADSLSTSPPAVAAEVQAYVHRHRQSCDIDVLRTIMAIQDGITRVSESAAEGRGGTGFQDVFELVEDLGTPHVHNCEPKVTIVSGNACLKLHGPYSVGKRTAGDPFSPRQIWFNGDNDSASPPDASHAFRLRQSFPGTLVTMSFVFTPEPIEGAYDGGDRAE